MENETIQKEEQDFNITTNNTELLKNSFKVISNIVTETKINISENCLSIIAMDPANVCLIEYKLFSGNCQNWDINENIEIGINTQEVYNILKKAKKDDQVILQKNKDHLVIILKGNLERKHTIPLLNTEDLQTTKTPELSFKTKVIMDSKKFSDIIKEFKDFETLNLKTTEEEINFKVDTDLNKIEIAIKKEETEINTEENALCKYSIEYLNKVIESFKISQMVKIEYNTDHPLSLLYEVMDTQYLRFILAHRVTDD